MASRRRGFTLIELLVAVIIVSFLGAVIYTSLSYGLKSWRRAAQGSLDSDADLLIEKMTADLHNIFRFKTEALIGVGDSLQFYTLVPAPDPRVEKDRMFQQPVRVRYYLDRTKQSLMRSQEPYQNLLSPDSDFKEFPQLVLQGVREWSLEYYSSEPASQAGTWIGHWRGGCLPLAVKVALMRHQGKQNQKTEQIIQIPNGGCPT